MEGGHHQWMLIREQIKNVKQKKEKENREESKQLSGSLNGRKAIQDVSLALFSTYKRKHNCLKRTNT